MTTIVIIGTGNLSKQWASSIYKINGYGIQAVVGRSIEALESFKDKWPVSLLQDPIPKADIYLLAVSDDAISEVSTQLEGYSGLVAHSSGAVSINAIIPEGRRAVIYPLQSFTGGAMLSLREVPICLECENPDDKELLHNLASQLSNRIEWVSSEKRKYLHLAAVFVNNFVNHLYYIAQNILDSQAIDPTLLLPLIKETSAKLEKTDAFNNQTGPARRGDESTRAMHEALLSDPNYTDIYRLISNSIQKTYNEKLQGKA